METHPKPPDGCWGALVLDDHSTLFRSGEIRVTDESSGVISWPGYQAYVLEAVGESTVVSLLDTD